MPDIFDEMNMRQALDKHIPNGETLLAGIHAISKEIDIKGTFGRCILAEDRLIPNPNGRIISLTKKKHSADDIYLGITQSFLVIAQCERSSYFYEFDDGIITNGTDIQEVSSELLLADIGTCFPLSHIQDCEMKKGWMGSVKCSITMENGSHFKLLLPKLGGLGGGMPHHKEYRQAIMDTLGEGSL